MWSETKAWLASRYRSDGTHVELEVGRLPRVQFRHSKPPFKLVARTSEPVLHDRLDTRARVRWEDRLNFDTNTANPL